MYSSHYKYVSKIINDTLSKSELDGVLIYAGNAQNYFLDDMPYAFASNPHFRWMVPVTDTPYCIIHYRPEQTPILYLYQPRDYWHSLPQVPTGEWTEFFDIKPIAGKGDLPDFSTLENHAWIGQEGSCEHENLQHNPKVYMDHVHYHRAVKTDYEIHNIKMANERALKGHAFTEKAFQHGYSEFETHLAYLQATRHTEAELPYGNIIAQNQNASVLHYQHMRKDRLAKRELKSFLIDAGATFNGYASDITRTYSMREDEFAQMIGVMDKVQQEICNNATAGTSYVDLHLGYHQTLARMLQDFGIVSSDPQTTLEAGLTSVFFPHGLGHFIGLQVHDIGGHQSDENGEILSPPESHPFLRLTRTLEENHVLTVEPGLYFIDILLQEAKANQQQNSLINWSRVEQLKPYGGIRIEDNVVVKKDKPHNLTRS